MLSAPFVRVNEVTAVPATVVDAVKLTPDTLLMVKDVIPAAASSLPVTCAALPL